MRPFYRRRGAGECRRCAGPAGGNTCGAIKKSRNSCPLGWFSPSSGSYWVKNRLLNLNYCSGFTLVRREVMEALVVPLSARGGAILRGHSNCFVIKERQAMAGLLSLPLRGAAQTVARQGRAPYGTSPLRCGGGRVDKRHYETCGPDTPAPLGSELPHLLPIPNRYYL